VRNFWTVALLIGALWMAHLAPCADTPGYAPLAAENARVPRTLLHLVHALEVQNELGVNDGNRAAVEQGLRPIDAAWWPSRILAADKQRQLTVDLEKKLAAHVEQILGDQATRRLHQIEYQSQAVRVLARPEVAQRLGLKPDQVERFNNVFAETDRLAGEIDPRKPDPAKVQALDAAKANELKSADDILDNEQQQTLQALLGKKLDTSKLERIYPLAPELIVTAHRYGEGPAELSKLKGQVVLIHFYAFQCHNCVANFNHYKRWSETWKNKGVAVIGIQTPETANERDPQKIAEAAKQAGFQFPVIMDLENKNWNAWGNTMWPTVYVVDKNGYIRFWWQGELNWDGATGDKKIEELVERLLKEA